MTRDVGLSFSRVSPVTSRRIKKFSIVIPRDMGLGISGNDATKPDLASFDHFRLAEALNEFGFVGYRL